MLERFARELGSDEERAPRRRHLRSCWSCPIPLLAAYLLGPAVPRDPDLARLVRRIIAGAPGPAEAGPRAGGDAPTVDHVTALGSAGSLRHGRGRGPELS